MKTLFFIFSFLICGLTTFGQANWTVTTSDIIFKIKNAGFKVDGSFNGFTAKILFDPVNLSESTIQASVDAKTINTGIGMRDNHIKKEEYFGVEKYPKITMKSLKFISKGTNNYIGTFQLTIKSITKTIDMPFTFTESGKLGIFKGSFMIKRQDYNVGGNSWTMSDNVLINILINSTKSIN